ncbi:MAG: hypothetical protein CMP59_00860 [Flavobacteriales bacterium]|nr:hypothetical protein [Flavobacteriales bacterium]
MAKGHEPLSQSLAFHIKLAATLNAKANPKAASVKLRLAAILRFQLSLLLAWLAFAIFSFQIKKRRPTAFSLDR